MVENFGDQLLYLRNLPATSPDGVFYPNWDDELRKSFRRETELLFESIIKENRNVVDLLTADYTFLNERLAKHYGIPNIYGSQFRRVTLGPDLAYRRGLLGQGSVLSLTWVQNFRTSPVKRGVWVLENILGTPPPEPPPNVPAAGGQQGRRTNYDAARADDHAPENGAVRELPQAHGSRSASLLKISMPTGRGEPNRAAKAGFRWIHPPYCGTAPK